MPFKGRFSEDIYQNMVVLYKQGLSTVEIGKIYNIHGGSVYDILKYRGVVFRSMKIAKRKYFVDETKFSIIDSEESSYWLGFLYADGGIVRNDLVLALREADIEHLKKFNSFLKSDYPIKQISKNKTVRVDIRSGEIVENLISLGCTPRKSLTLTFPHKLDPFYYNHFIRGYFDGDGSIHSQAMGRNPVISIAGTEIFLDKIKEILTDQINTTGKIDKHSISKIYYLRYFGACQVEAVRQWLYKDATIFLDRKVDVFNQVYKGRDGHPARLNYVYVDS